ncbi:MAG: PHP domain-containing protein, partial [Caldilinea sp.]
MSRKKKSNSGGTQPTPPPKNQRRWYKVDLHLHTPASHDYEEPGTSYLDWLRKAAQQGLEMVAITDHNTVAGISAIRKELDWLTQLEAQGRLTDPERARLQGWREAANQVVVLPGFEFTATFGFHILAIFPAETSIRQLEHILL